MRGNTLSLIPTKSPNTTTYQYGYSGSGTSQKVYSKHRGRQSGFSKSPHSKIWLSQQAVSVNIIPNATVFSKTKGTNTYS